MTPWLQNISLSHHATLTGFPCLFRAALPGQSLPRYRHHLPSLHDRQPPVVTNLYRQVQQNVKILPFKPGRFALGTACALLQPVSAKSRDRNH
jgi:hypothetical protein